MKTDIIVFDAGGGKVRVLGGAGPNIGSVLSPSGNDVADWKTTPKTGTTSRMNSWPFDLYVFDLRTGEETLYSGINRFYAAGPIYFKSGDLIYSSATAPQERSTRDLGEYLRRINGSEIFGFDKRAAAATAMFTDIGHARNLSLDRRGNACLIGERPDDRGISFIRANADGSRQFVAVPRVAFIAEAACDASGETLMFLYPADDTLYVERKFGLGLANLTTGAIDSVNLPLLQEAEMIHAD